MGLFSFIGDILGGGGSSGSVTSQSTTTQSTQNISVTPTTNVGVSVPVTIDFDKLGEALESYGSTQNDLTKAALFNELVIGIAGIETARQAAMVEASTAQAELNQNAEIKAIDLAISEERWTQLKKLLPVAVGLILVLMWGKK